MRASSLFLRGPLAFPLLAWLAACADVEAEALPPPVAGLVHPQVARIGQTVLFDARTSAVAKASSADPAAAGSKIAKFRFALADGTAASEQAGPLLERSFAQAGSYAVELTVFDDRGFAGRVTSLVHIVADYTATCGGGDVTACATGVCSGDTCAVLACGAQPACPLGLGPHKLTCTAGLCAAVGKQP